MTDKFDELTKGLAQSVSRREVFKKLGLGLAGMAMACFGLATTAQAGRVRGFCQIGGNPFTSSVWFTGFCLDVNGCVLSASSDCPAAGTSAGVAKAGKLKEGCFTLYRADRKCSVTV